MEKSSVYQIITILMHLMKKTTSDESPIIPRTDSLFEVKNWTGLLKRENGNQAVTFPRSAELYELKDGEEEKLEVEVKPNGNLYNLDEVCLCQRRVFKIKVKGGESDPIIWTPRNYANVS